MADLRPTVTLDVFSGPLDLLLYLVHNRELDPRTIPLAEIADQYLAFLQDAREAQLGIAGEFLVMAAKLLSLKARELLPREEQGELEPEEFDGFDREELVRQLLEYRRFKQAAEKIRALEALQWGAYPRGLGDLQADRPQEDDDDTLEAGAVGLFDLLKAFRQVLAVRPRTLVHEIEIDDIPIEDRMNRIRAHLVREGKAHFEELYPRDGRRLLPVVTFMAILELVKTEELAFRQSGTWQPMLVYRRADDRFADELARMEQVFTADPELNPDVLGLLAEKERMRLEALAREEALWGGTTVDEETGEILPGEVPAGDDEPVGAASSEDPTAEVQPAPDALATDAVAHSIPSDPVTQPEVAPESDPVESVVDPTHAPVADESLEPLDEAPSVEGEIEPEPPGSEET